MRTLSYRAWKVNSLRLKEIARYPIKAPPSASQLLTILTIHIQRIQEWEMADV